jgi:hypothetical protein
MPMFDYTTPSRFPAVRPSFWLYWVVAAPLTAVVLAAYLLYVVITEHRHRIEEQQARAESFQASASSSSVPR